MQKIMCEENPQREKPSTLSGEFQRGGSFRGALRSGLYAQRPPVQVEVGADVTLTDLGGHAADIGAMARTIANGLTVIGNAFDEGTIAATVLGVPTFDVVDVDGLITLYAAVAAEGDELGAVLESGGKVKAADLGTLERMAADRLMLRSADSLSLMMSRAASATQRLERDGLVIPDRKTDRGRLLAPELARLAGQYRACMRQMKVHAGYLVWLGSGADAETMDPAMVLEARRRDE